jgi:hypothetical protein
MKLSKNASCQNTMAWASVDTTRSGLSCSAADVPSRYKYPWRMDVLTRSLLVSHYQEVYFGGDGGDKAVTLLDNDARP